MKRPERFPPAGRSPRDEDEPIPTRVPRDEVSRRHLLRWAGLLGLGSLAPGLVGCSDPPEEELLDTTTEPTTLQAGGVVSGTVAGFFAGESMVGATVDIRGNVTTTDSFGRFSVRIPESGDFPVRITGSGFLPRRGAVRLTGNVELAITVIEEDPSPPLDFIDQFARGTGPVRSVSPRTPGRTNRWTRPPEVQIFRRVPGTGGTASEVSLSDQRIEVIEIVFREVFPILSGGRLGPTPEVAVVDRPPPADPRRFPEGVLSIYQTADGSHGGGNVGTVADEWAIAHSRAFTDVEAPTPLIAKAIGFGLGASDVSDDHRSVMNASGRRRPTESDAEAARILYGRPPGSRSPDVDPAGSFLNA